MRRSKVNRSGGAGMLSGGEFAKVQAHVRMRDEEKWMAQRSKELNAKGAKTVFEEEFRGEEENKVDNQENGSTTSPSGAATKSPAPKSKSTPAVLTPTGGPWLAGRKPPRLCLGTLPCLPFWTSSGG